MVEMQLPIQGLSILIIGIEYILHASGGRNFTLYSGKHSWCDTQELCRRHGQHMLRLKTERQLEMFNEFMRKWKMDKDLNTNVWVGLYDLEPENGADFVHTWTDGTPLGTSDEWETGEPNGKGTDNCVRYTASRKFRTKECDKRYASVCETETDDNIWSREHCVIRADGTCNDKSCCKAYGTSANDKTSSVVCTPTTAVPSPETTRTSAQTTSDVTTAQTTSDVTTAQTTSDVTTSQTTSDVTTAQTTSDVTTSQTTSDVTPSQTTSDVTPAQTLSSLTTDQTASAGRSDATASLPKGETTYVQIVENICPDCEDTSGICVWVPSDGPHVEEINKIIKALILDRKTLSNYKRRKTSSKDDRPTAQAIGQTGVVLCVLPLVVVVLLDVGRLIAWLKIWKERRVSFISP